MKTYWISRIEGESPPDRRHRTLAAAIARVSASGHYGTVRKVKIP